jgi:hypothetical protein
VRFLLDKALVLLYQNLFLLLLVVVEEMDRDVALIIGVILAWYVTLTLA